MWAVCVYLEAIAVLLQLTMMQKTKMIEPSTAHYVFALGFARFLGSAAWIIQVYAFAGAYLFLLGSGYFWLPAVLIG
ncbi:putative ER lumen protein retaining receptor [Helianthus annuus]|uniref:ER lumen protein retaining receptor n=2 Tax=Helianthus annuus TaxID=4232 RepID=A0A9K3N9M5_HELAN|nr:putative ER lumen protein retaining receptor [Helianthus annuus]KAJ0526765.1 putative ER lumen protein retaining receptor [Helianthus annuus]KAJ0543159.1 putative ER lumen protein retaining receptor [Helianthus annuus]KAJ0708211.1 putative ER lumen protein retaining receptor [Helianthus annuus]KAJ0712170.1 putative ER lumen protein retaining receptor [Helianthus annuus]